MRYTNRNYCNRKHGIFQCCKVFKRTFKFCAVIPAGAQNNLRVERNFIFAEPVKIIHNLSGIRVSEHFDTQFGVSCVDRNVKRSEVHTRNALFVLVVEICERNISTLQIRKPVIIVFYIKRVAQTLWLLVNETKNAFVQTGFNPVKHSAFKNYAQILVVILFKLDNFNFLCSGFLDFERQKITFAHKIVVNHISHWHFVD